MLFYDLDVRIAIRIGERFFIDVGGVDRRFVLRRNQPLTIARSSSVRSAARAGRPSSRTGWILSKISSSRFASLSPPDLAARIALSRRFSTEARSARASSIWIVSMSRTGLTEPSTWMIFSSSKQRTTWMTASVSRIFARNWLPRPSPFDAPRTRPAISTNSTVAGTIYRGFYDLCKRFEAFVRHGDDADIRLDRRKWIICRQCRLLRRQSIKKCRFSDVGQANDSCL